MARAARLSGADPDDEDYEEFEEMLEQAESAQVSATHGNAHILCEIRIISSASASLVKIFF